MWEVYAHSDIRAHRQGTRPSSLTSLAPSGLEARGQWCQMVPGSWSCHLPAAQTWAGLTLSEFQVPQSGQFDFPTGRGCHPGCSAQGELTTEGVRAELGSLPSTPCFPGFKGGVQEWGWRGRRGSCDGARCCAKELDPRPVSGGFRASGSWECVLGRPPGAVWPLDSGES